MVISQQKSMGYKIISHKNSQCEDAWLECPESSSERPHPLEHTATSSVVSIVHIEKSFCASFPGSTLLFRGAKTSKSFECVPYLLSQPRDF